MTVWYFVEIEFVTRDGVLYFDSDFDRLYCSINNNILISSITFASKRSKSIRKRLRSIQSHFVWLSSFTIYCQHFKIETPYKRRKIPKVLIILFSRGSSVFPVSFSHSIQIFATCFHLICRLGFSFKFHLNRLVNVKSFRTVKSNLCTWVSILSKRGGRRNLNFIRIYSNYVRDLSSEWDMGQYGGISQETL